MINLSVSIIDYGMGNIFSVKRAFEKCNADVYIAYEPDKLHNASHIVLPGVGAFNDGMKNLRAGGWINALDEIVLKKKIPLLGICLGMQLLSDIGYEMGETEGLGYIKGKVIPIVPKNNERIPHVGWNDIKLVNDSEITRDISDKTDFYFVHSYHFMADNEEDIVANTDYAGGFVSIISKENIYGTQFHPEKSQKAGFKIIKNFLSL